MTNVTVKCRLNYCAVSPSYILTVTRTARTLTRIAVSHSEHTELTMPRLSCRETLSRVSRLPLIATALWSVTACGSSSESVKVGSVTVAPATATKAVGETQQLAASTLDAGGTVITGRTVTWSTSSTSIATVSGGGLVTGVAPGAAIITATSEGKAGTAAITIVPPRVASVTITPALPTVQEGTTTQLTAVTKTAAGTTVTGRTVTWSSATNATATVSNQGLVTGNSVGTTVITATSEGVSSNVTVTVMVGPCSLSQALPFIPGQVITGTLATTDCPFYDGVQYDGTFLDIYKVTMTASATVDFLLKSTAFDAYLFVYAVNATGTALVKIGEDDSSGGGTDARLTGLLTPGTYYVIANSGVPGFGTYTLTFTSPAPTGISHPSSSRLESINAAPLERRMPESFVLRGLVRHR